MARLVATETLRDFIARRELEVKEQIKLLRAELAELKIAKGALDPQASSLADEDEQAGVTIKGMVREILAIHPSGLTSGDILARIDSMYGKNIERTSLSPQLSRLRKDGELTLVDNYWVLAGSAQHFGDRKQREFEVPNDPFEEEGSEVEF